MGDYRDDARKQLKRAQAELASGDDQRLKYAALELREAMESVTYDRAEAYKDDFPPEQYEAWQPRRVMGLLLEIDPNADKDSTIAFGEEPSLGVKPAVMHTLGTEKVLNMKMLKKHYDALGSYLHVPTLKQMAVSDKIDFAAMRQRCEIIAAFITDVLGSPVFNSTFGNFATIDCMKCGKPIKRRWPEGKEQIEAKCFECGAGYLVKDIGNAQCEWKPDVVELACANKECGTKINPFRHEVELGVGWDCEDCGGRNVMRLGVAHIPKAEDGF
ncbi:hypothetical protein [Sphingobium sp. 15-1]|uniref:hypothetical protein n=1 Tax=Sphingobium sp. 15-1 TaxID=2729616 RepID=UPI00159C9E76|nr:hypothetical protein [Sphingobium sp. 15-1]